jgi:phospholipid N-methyltransferase
MNRIKFLTQFLNPKEKVGAVTPSSKFLIKKMLKPIDFKTARLIIELGPGFGNITKEILKKAHPDCKLIAFEVNTEFVTHLQDIKDERFTVIHDSAEHINEYLKQLKYKNADYIISGIPLGMMPKKLVDRITGAAYTSLQYGGKFIQFQYSLIEYKHLKNKFSDVKLDFTPLNIPPAFVYICIK